GGSWARLGSDGAWVPLIEGRDISVAPLQPANCGFLVASPRTGAGGWSEHLRSRFAGQPLKSVAMRLDGEPGDQDTPPRPGEAMITVDGIEGSLIYALSAAIRERINTTGSATLLIDLAPGRPLERVLAEASHPRGARSLASHLQSRVGIAGIKMALLRECLTPDELADPALLAAGIKALRLRLTAARPLDEAISSAGGVCFENLDEGLMVRRQPGLFMAGEMLDWEAPTGGYLLTACLASGRRAGEGALAWLAARQH
nr:TIGR03862 family flavoprotein [Zoogloea sp.]